LLKNIIVEKVEKTKVLTKFSYGNIYMSSGHVPRMECQFIDSKIFDN
jgi:hypothetical protein